MGVGAPAEPTFGHRALQERGIFSFNDALPITEEVMGSFGDLQIPARERQLAIDFLLLSAAEWTLLDRFVHPEKHAVLVPLSEPIDVDADNVWAAAAKADCGWTDIHGLKTDPAAVRPWDVLLFAGDMSKAELCGWSPAAGPQSVESLIHDLHNRYSESRASQGQLTARSGVLVVQGLLWKAKFALHVDADGMDNHVDAYLDTFPVLR